MKYLKHDSGSNIFAKKQYIKNYNNPPHQAGKFRLPHTYINMYNYNELEAMDDSQLREIGKSHGIKKFETSDKENLIYDILEQQARDVAATSTANISKGRRPKKEVKDDKSQATTKQKKNNADDNQQPKRQL